MASKDARLKKKRKVILIGVILLIAVVAAGTTYGFIFRANAEREVALKQKITDFYNDFTYEINTNEDWVGFIDKYSMANAKGSLSVDAVSFLDDANKGSQHLGRILSPVSVRVYRADNKSADVLVDFSFGERIVGEPEQISDIKKFITLEWDGSDWKISGILDRSERFDQKIKI